MICSSYNFVTTMVHNCYNMILTTYHDLKSRSMLDDVGEIFRFARRPTPILTLA